MFFDTHCHLDMMVSSEEHCLLREEHFAALDRVIDVIRGAGIVGMINIGACVEGSKNSVALARRYQDVFASIGIHPCDCGDTWQDDLRSLEHYLQNIGENKIVGIGETGLDFFHKPFDKERQIAAFREQISLALRYQLPVIVHSRDASDETLTILQEYIKDGLRGVWHCYSHPAYVAEQVLSWGFYIGIGGYVTYPKNDGLRNIVKHTIPLDRLVLETDAPFLPPQQFRGKQNTPAYIPLFAHMIAELKELNAQELAQKTLENTQRLFGVYPRIT